MNRGLIHLLVACCASVSGTAIAADTAESLLAAYVAQAGAPASPERGQKLFTTNFGKDYNGCVDCHTASPAKDGKDLLTDKRIAPLAPAANKAWATRRLCKSALSNKRPPPKGDHAIGCTRFSKR